MAPSDSDEHSFSALVQDLAQAFVTSDEVLQLPEAAQQRFHARLAELPEEQQEDTVAELLAVAVLFQRQAGEAADHAVEQLAELVTAILGDGSETDALSHDEEGAAQAQLTGAQASKIPVGSGDRPAGAFNPMALRLGQSDKKKR